MGTGIMLQKEDYNKEEATFPSQELPCSGSTGLISASNVIEASNNASAPRGKFRYKCIRIKK